VHSASQQQQPAYANGAYSNPNTASGGYSTSSTPNYLGLQSLNQRAAQQPLFTFDDEESSGSVGKEGQSSGYW
jgi:hypothetical protein